MKKLGCAKCGGTKKMKLGGSAVAKAPVNIFGIPQQNLGTSGQLGNMKKGGTTNVHPLTAFRKFDEARKATVKKSITKYQLKGEVQSDSSTMKNAFSKDLMDAKYEEAMKKASDKHKSELKRISQDDLIRQNKAAFNTTLKGYKPNSSTKASMKKMQTGGKIVKPTADSTEIYTKRLNTFTKNHGGSLPVKQLSIKDTHKEYKMVTDVQRQRNKGQAGYDKNGFPIKKK
jgi:dsDNA-specific endonuclease/ATPase MutS2